MRLKAQKHSNCTKGRLLTEKKICFGGRKGTTRWTSKKINWRHIEYLIGKLRNLHTRIRLRVRETRNLLLGRGVGTQLKLKKSAGKDENQKKNSANIDFDEDYNWRLEKYIRVVHNYNWWKSSREGRKPKNSANMYFGDDIKTDDWKNN